MLRALCDTIEPQNIELKMMNAQAIFFQTFIIRYSGFGIRDFFNDNLSRFEKKHYPLSDLAHKNILPPDNFL